MKYDADTETLVITSPSDKQRTFTFHGVGIHLSHAIYQAIKDADAIAREKEAIRVVNGLYDHLDSYHP